MPKLSQIQKANETKNVTIDFGDGETVNLVVYPNRITGTRRRQLNELDRAEELSDDEQERYADLFFAIIKEWDLTDEQEVPLPFTVETIELLSVPTTIMIFSEISDAVNPTTKTSKRSRGR